MLKLMAMGYVGNEPEEKTLDDGRLMVKFRLGARQRGKEEGTTWINMTCFGKNAELAKRYLHKGSQILAFGQIKVHGYKNKSEEIVASIDMVLDEFEFAGGRTDNADTGTAAPTPVDNSDIPF